MNKNASREYNKYITKHIANVQAGYSWLKTNLPNLFTDDVLKKNNVDIYEIDDQLLSHDDPKYSNEEWDAYANYFYGEKTSEVKEAFNYAWLHHIHNDPHHWQHWVLINDDDGTNALEMPYNYVIEMISDWWAFSWAKGELDEIFKWYDSHKEGMLLNKKTKQLVESILEDMHDVLKEQELI